MSKKYKEGDNILSVIKGTSIGWSVERLTEDRNALGLGILNIFSTWELKTKEQGYKVTREDGKILKAYSGLTNDIHNLSIIIDMMMQIINKSKVDKDLKSKDFLYINILLESYFTNLRSIFDFTAILIRIALTDENINKLPSKQEDSFNRMLKYVKNENTKGIIQDEIINAMIQHEDTFSLIREIRDLIIHKGDETIIFREDDGFTFGLFRYEDVKAINKFDNILKIEKERYPLLKYLSEITNRVLLYLDDLAEAIYNCLYNEDKEPLFLAALQGYCIPAFIQFLELNKDNNNCTGFLYD